MFRKLTLWGANFLHFVFVFPLRGTGADFFLLFCENKFPSCKYVLYICGNKSKKDMKNIPSARIQKNIENFCSMWDAGDMVACRESYTAARRYLDAFGDWLFKNMEPQYNLLVGVIEYTNFHDRADTSVKKWKL